MHRNLLKNPCGKEGLESWDITKNGGDGWKVEDLPEYLSKGLTDKNVKSYFASSFELCLKKQVIDLVAEGYLPDELDDNPVVKVKDWYCSRHDCGCEYQLTVGLLDKDFKVIQEFKPEKVHIDPTKDGDSWKKIDHKFSGYGPGIRFISFEHGGKDAKWWKGWYGVRVTNSSVTINL